MSKAKILLKHAVFDRKKCILTQIVAVDIILAEKCCLLLLILWPVIPYPTEEKTFEDFKV